MDQCKNLVKNVNTWSETNRKLGKEMYTFVNTSTSIDSMIMKEYKESVVDLHDVFQKEYDETRRAITVILRVRVIARIESLLKSGTSNIDSIWKVRKNIMLDYESHVQKASLYEQKGEKSQANYFRQKAAHDKGMFKEHTSFLSGVFDTFIDSGSRLLMLETSTLVTCEMYMVKRQYDALAAIGNNIGEDIISAIMDELEDVIGRIRRGEDVEKSYVPPSLPFSLPSMETAPKYVPFHEYVKKENVDISKPIAVEALSDGEESVVSSVPEDHDFSPSLSPSAAPTTSSPMYPMWFESDASNSFEWANEQEVDEDSLGEEEEVEPAQSEGVFRGGELWVAQRAEPVGFQGQVRRVGIDRPRGLSVDLHERINETLVIDAAEPFVGLAGQGFFRLPPLVGGLHFGGPSDGGEVAAEKGMRVMQFVIHGSLWVKAGLLGRRDGAASGPRGFRCGRPSPRIWLCRAAG